MVLLGEGDMRVQPWHLQAAVESSNRDLFYNASLGIRVEFHDYAVDVSA